MLTVWRKVTMRMAMQFQLSLFVFLASIGSSVAAEPILWPCEHAIAGYETGVERQIGAELPAVPEISAITYPSFSAEWGIALVRGEEGPAVVLSELAKSYWAIGWVQVDESQAGNAGASNGPIITKWNYENGSAPEIWAWDADAANGAVLTESRSVSTELATALQEVGRVAMASIGPRNLNCLGADGVTYDFKSGEQTCGSTWSPDANSMPGKLVGLLEQLRLLAQSSVEPDAGEREKEVLRLADEFLGEFRRQQQAP